MMTDEFFFLLRVGLGLENPESFTGKINWKEIVELGRRQAVLGILMAGAEKVIAGGADGPDRQLLMKWIAIVERIRRANKALTEKCAMLTAELEGVQLQSCVLKGQGVARYYPDPSLRQSGDIDLWVRPLGMKADRPEAYIKTIAERLRSLGKGAVHHAMVHHMEWDVPGLEVEVHFRLMYFNSPRALRRFDRWSMEQWRYVQPYQGFYHPAPQTDAVYLLVHIYRHLLLEGVGLRQIMDYAMLLMHCDFSEAQRNEIDSTIKALGMKRFARAMMWVMADVFHVPSDRMLWAPDDNDGRMLLDEIMMAGNFGRYDKRINRDREKTVGGRFWERTKRRSRFIRRYTSEVAWDIPFRLWHWYWRKRYGL